MLKNIIYNRCFSFDCITSVMWKCTDITDFCMFACFLPVDIQYVKFDLSKVKYQFHEIERNSKLSRKLCRKVR